MNYKDKIIALDIDGTIAKDNMLPTRYTYNKISKLIKKGYNVVLITGRGYAQIKPIYEKCKMNTFCVLFNGALVYNPTTNEVIRNVKFPKNYLFDFVNNKIIKDTILDVMVEQDDVVYSLKGYPWVKKQVVGDFKDNLKDNIYCINVRVDDPKKQEIIADIVNKNDHYKYRYWHYQAEIYCLDYTKYDGTKTLLQYYNKDFNDLIFIGDSDNDIELLQTAGISIAMKNATETAKKAAKQITKLQVGENGAIKHIYELLNEK